jgi:multidrug efflux system membrane fusion protein
MAFPENGVVSELLVEEGDSVVEGQILARLNIGILEAEEAIAAEQVKFQSLKFKQYERLRASGNASIEEYERSKSDLEIASLNVQRIKAQIKDRSLIAPFDAVVDRIHLELSESATAQAKAITLVDLKSLKLTLNVPITEARGLAVSQTVPLNMELFGAIDGVIDFISPTYDAASQTVRVQIIIENADSRLRSGLRTALVP